MKKIIEALLYMSSAIYLYFFTGRIKAMFIYGEAIIIEPSKFIAGFEYYYGILLTMFISYIFFIKFFDISKSFCTWLVKKKKEVSDDKIYM